jgi:hypothetical protein
MYGFRRLCQYSLCFFGMHTPPPQRYPHGPIVADCPCCGRTCYFYGLSAYGLGGPPVLEPVRLVAIAARPAS